MASASTVTVGTSTSLGTTNVSGCLSTWSNSSDRYQTNSVAVSGSLQLVGSVAIDGGIGKHTAQGAGNTVLQGDGSLSIVQTHETGSDSSGSSFHGTETQTGVTTGSSAFTSFSGQ